MTALVMSALPDAVAAKIRVALPELATCKGIVGRLDLDEVQAKAYATPAVLVSRMRMDQGRGFAGPLHVYRVMMAAFVLTKDMLGLPRDTAATNIAQVILQLLPEARFGLSGLGPAERISEEPIVTPAIRKAGVALTAITWEADLTLQTLPEAAAIVPELYVRMNVSGTPAEEFEITGGGA